MCGILGLIPFRGGALTKENQISELMTLLAANEVRGEDATGVARGGDKPKIVKGNVKASTFIQSEHFLRMFDDDDTPQPYIGHCRKGTVGAADDNENNHPLFVGDFVVIHNGSVKNKPVGSEVLGKVDSLYFPWVFDKVEKAEGEITNRAIQKIVENTDGSFALCWYNLKEPNIFYLIRDKVDARKVYYSFTDDYFKFTQIDEEGLSTLEPYNLIVINAETGDVKLFPLAVGRVPVEILEFIKALSIPESVVDEGVESIKDFILQEIEGGCCELRGGSILVVE